MVDLVMYDGSSQMVQGCLQTDLKVIVISLVSGGNGRPTTFSKKFLWRMKGFDREAECPVVLQSILNFLADNFTKS